MWKKICFILAIIISLLIPLNVIAEEVTPQQYITTPIFKLALPTWATADSSFDADINSFAIKNKDKESNFSVAFKFEPIEKSSLEDIRKYLNDDSISDESIFNMIFSYGTSYYNALEEDIKNNVIVSDNIITKAENNMTIMGSKNEKLFGKEAYSIIYNVIYTKGNISQEDSYIEFLIPSLENSGIITISFKQPKESLGYSTILPIYDILSHLTITNHDIQTTVPLILLTNSNLDRAMSGIYPSENTTSNMKYIPYSNKKTGLNFTYPSYFVPIKGSSFIDTVQYNTFRVNAFTNFTVEMIDKTSELTMQNEINKQLFSAGSNSVINKIDIQQSEFGNVISIDYSFKRDDNQFVAYACFLESKDKFVTYTFESSVPSEITEMKQLAKNILMSTNFVEGETHTKQLDFSTFENESFKFSHPKDWIVKKENDKLFAVTSTDVSTFKISVYEEELIDNMNYNIAATLAKAPLSTYMGYFKNGYLPFQKYKNVTSASNFQFDNGVAKIKRISEYIDENNRLHQCYAYSISKDKKLYTLLIDLNVSLLQTESSFSENIILSLNEVAESFFIK